MDDSKKNSLSANEVHRIWVDALVFFIPVVNIYLGSLAVLFMTEGHRFSWMDFTPTAFVLGGLFKHFQDTLINIYGKYKQGK